MRSKNLFKIQMPHTLSQTDYNVLALLYQPIMGAQAYALYMMLTQISKLADEKYTHQFLLDLMNFKMKEFETIRFKLEALNLIETYQDMDEYLYILKQPFTPRQFLLDTVLGSFLESQIGDENTKKIATLFEVKKIDVSNYENISKNFDDVFEFRALDLLKLDHHVSGKEKHKIRFNFSFDYEIFLNNLTSRHKKPALLDDAIQEKIEQIAYVYGLTEIEMAEIYNENANGHMLSVDELNLFAKVYFEKNQKAVLGTVKTDDTIFDFDTLNPKQIIAKFCKVEFQGMALSTVTELLQRKDVEVGIVNVLLMFILKTKDGILPNVNYLDKVLNSWLSKGVKTTQDAYKHAKGIEESYQSYSKPYNSKNKVDTPDWFDRYVKELEEME